jgi:hypothetical protein
LKRCTRAGGKRVVRGGRDCSRFAIDVV